MKIEANESMESRKEHLAMAAERCYGPERATEIADQIEHLARMMTQIARMPLEIDNEPLPGPVDRKRGSK